ncbi:MAG: type 4a pilus biogenesis protein PilO [Patescibacteria group bacterium]
MKIPLFIFLILILLSIALGVFLVWPSYKEFSSLRQQVQEQEGTLRNKENIIAHLNELRKEFDGYEKELAKIHASLPADTQLPLLYDSMQHLASSSGLGIRSLDSSTRINSEEEKKRVKNPMKITSLSLELEGSYEGFKQFLSRVKTTARMLNAQSMKISSKKAEELQIDLTLEAYSY